MARARQSCLVLNNALLKKVRNRRSSLLSTFADDFYSYGNDTWKVPANEARTRPTPVNSYTYVVEKLSALFRSTKIRLLV